MNPTEPELHTIAPGDAQLRVEVALPPGTRLAEGAPVRLAVDARGAVRLATGARYVNAEVAALPAALPLEAMPGEGRVVVDLTVAYRPRGDAADVRVERARLAADVAVEESARAMVVELNHRVRRRVVG